MSLVAVPSTMFQLPTLKRSRDDEDDLMDSSVDHKKLRSLPFRAFPNTKAPSLFFSQSRHISHPPLLTPADSSEDDSDDEVLSPVHRLPPGLVTDGPMHIDDEDDMPGSATYTSPAWSPKTTSPPLLPKARPTRLRSSSQLSTASSTDHSRIPTPIYSQFGSLSFTPTDNVRASPPPGYSPGPVRARANFLDDAAKHALYLRRHRLPSPIHEIDMDAPAPQGRVASLDCAPPTPRSADSGRKRSDAISDGGRSEPGERAGSVVFSMGFRAGCERCRERVPGHYNHVLRGC